jgi:hypothetical protein
MAMSALNAHRMNRNAASGYRLFAGMTNDHPPMTGVAPGMLA